MDVGLKEVGSRYSVKEVNNVVARNVYTASDFMGLIGTRMWTILISTSVTSQLFGVNGFASLLCLDGDPHGNYPRAEARVHLDVEVAVTALRF
jgi:hypothetical protein